MDEIPQRNLIVASALRLRNQCFLLCRIAGREYRVYRLLTALQPDNPLGNPLIIAGEPATEEMIGASNKVAPRYFETARTRSQNP